MAIAYTFHENFLEEYNHVCECLAIIKLATIIEEQWIHEQINNHLKEYQINDKAIIAYVNHC